MSSRKIKICSGRTYAKSNMTYKIKVEPQQKVYKKHHKAIDTNDIDKLNRALCNHPDRLGEKELFTEAILSGNVQIVRALFEHGCPRHIDRYLFERAINKGYIEIVRYLHSVGLVWEKENSISSIKMGNLDLLQFMHENKLIEGMKLAEDTFYICAKKGYVDCLRFLHERAYTCSWRPIFAAFINNKLECVKFLYENDVFEGSSANEHTDIYNYCKKVELIEYAHRVMRIPFVKSTLINSMYRMEPKAFKYLIDNGCYVSRMAIRECVTKGRIELLTILLERGYSIPKRISISSIDNVEMAHFYHEHFYDRKLCAHDCYYCGILKERSLWDSWDLIDDGFQSYIQWLPREMMEDVDEFLYAKHNTIAFVDVTESDSSSSSSSDDEY